MCIKELGASSTRVAERMRLDRQRRRQGIQYARIPLHLTKIDEFIKLGTIKGGSAAKGRSPRRTCVESRPTSRGGDTRCPCPLRVTLSPPAIHPHCVTRNAVDARSTFDSPGRPLSRLNLAQSTSAQSLICRSRPTRRCRVPRINLVLANRTFQ